MYLLPPREQSDFVTKTDLLMLLRKTVTHYFENHSKRTVKSWPKCRDFSAKARDTIVAFGIIQD